VGIPDINQNVEPHNEHQINLRPGAKGKKIFTSTRQTNILKIILKFLNIVVELCRSAIQHDSH
jgi:hypothetical protein